MKLTAINALICKHTAFEGAIDLIKSARHPYRPTLKCLEPGMWFYPEHMENDQIERDIAERREIKIIADFYDAMMARIGINKAAYRY